MDGRAAGSPRNSSLREGCAQCGAFVGLLCAGAAAWLGVVIICSRIF